MSNTTPQQLRKDAADLREMVRRDPHSAARQASQSPPRGAAPRKQAARPMSRREHAMTLAAARDARRMGYRVIMRALLRDLVNGRAAGIQRLP